MAHEQNELVDLARQAQAKAYAPYSNFHVGCVLVGESGVLYRGCNVENGAYGSTICAERTAVVAAVVAGERAFSKLVLVTDSAKPEAPCGACRQVLHEFAPNLEIISVGTDGSEQHWTIAELLPAGFDLKSAGA